MLNYLILLMDKRVLKFWKEAFLDLLFNKFLLNISLWELILQKKTSKRPTYDQPENGNVKRLKSSGLDGSMPSLESSSVGSTYPATGLKRLLHGINYQLTVLMFFALQYQRGDLAFFLSTEEAGVESFDDLVLRYRNGQGKVQYRFLQAKHTQHLTEKSWIKYKELFKSNSRDFSLKKYFSSYQDILKNKEFSTDSIETLLKM